MKDANNTFLYPNQFCNFNGSTKAVKTGDELVQGITDTIEKVEAIYKYTVDNISYDYQKAKTVKSGYLPNVDDTLKTQKGICFDYAALMTGMLRSQGVPCKLVVGYAGSAYHAWISVWTEDTGWIDGAVYFNGTSWQLLDPTFAATSGGSGTASGSGDANSGATSDSTGADDSSPVGDGVNYTTKYIY